MTLTVRQRASYLAHLHKAVFRSYHAQLIPYLQRIIPADEIVIDVGAHAGQFTKIFARQARHGRVYAFEPASYARSILRTMCALRRLDNVTVVAAGLGSVRGRFELDVPVKPSGSLGFGLSHIRSADASSEPSPRSVTETVEVETLDHFVELHGLPTVCFVKADIEGWELHLLRGAESVLASHRPVLMLEVDGNALRRAGHTKPELFAFLADHGYGWRRIAGYGGKSRASVRLDDKQEDGNFFCFPEERLDEIVARLPAH